MIYYKINEVPEHSVSQINSFESSLLCDSLVYPSIFGLHKKYSIQIINCREIEAVGDPKSVQN
jgi:hypothetical protein